MKHALCIVVDRLSAGFLGAYGNSWIETPHIDHFASQAVVFDQTVIDSPQLPLLYESFWRGCHSLSSHPATAMPEVLKSAGIATWLFTDDSQVAGLELAELFDSRTLLAVADASQTAKDAEATHFAQWFAAASSQLNEIDRPTLFWLHTGGLAASWDAPLSFREAYAGPEDPLATDTARVPCLPWQQEFDPDELLGYAHAYAGQVALLDQCLGGLFQAIEERSLAQNTLIVLVAARGFPLGEHGQVGILPGEAAGEPLYGELIQIPLMVRGPGTPRSTRSVQLVQPPDIYATLVDWFRGSECAHDPPQATDLLQEMGPDKPIRTRAVVAGEGGQWAIRTCRWLLRCAADKQLELYAKPDDRWEINDVADRCPEVVSALSDAYRATCQGDWTSPVDIEQDPAGA